MASKIVVQFMKKVRLLKVKSMHFVAKFGHSNGKRE